MKFPPFCLLLIFAGIFMGCQQEDNQNQEVEPGKPAFYYKKGLEVSSDPEAMIGFFDKGLANVEDKNDSTLLKLLEGKTYAYTELKKTDSALFFANRFLEAAQFQKDTWRIARAFYRRGRIHFYLGNQEEVYRNSLEARKGYLAAKDSSEAGECSVEMAIAQSRMTDYQGSQKTATEALALLRPKTDSAAICRAFNNIAMAYREQGFYEDAKAEFKNSLKFAVSLQQRLTSKNNIALVLRDQNKFDEAIAIFEELVQVVAPQGKTSQARYLDNLAYTKWLQDSTARVEEDLHEALEIRLENNDNTGVLASFYHLSDFYKDKDKNLSKSYAEDLLEAAKKLGSGSSELEALKKLINLSTPEKSREYSKRYIRVSDSLSNASLRAERNFAKIEFDEERKQQEIANLESLTARQALENQKFRTRTIIMTFTAILVALGAGFVFYFFRERNKKEKIRAIHKTETRISKKIHDELANDIYNVMSQLEPLAATNQMDRLEHIYKRTRDISRENSDIDTGPGFVDGLISTLVSNIPNTSKIILRGQEILKKEKLSEEKKIVIYRVLQELLVNMKKHSDAGLVAIIFKKEDRKLLISYSDNGKGFEAGEQFSGNGLQNMKNRISSVNGRIDIISGGGKGFKAEIYIPF